MPWRYLFISVLKYPSFSCFSLQVLRSKALIETYENQNIAIIHGSPTESLRSLMKEHQLKQSELPEIGSQGVMSEILKGKRNLNIRQTDWSESVVAGSKYFVERIKET